MIDWNRVKELRDEIGEANLADVVALFLEEADDVAGRLARCATPAELEAALHFLKGASLNLGFALVADLCHAGERRAALGDTMIDTAQVLATYLASKAAFETGLADMGSPHAA
jgi:HPt (histidine-containing phosphotransfer) domain-containing protein